MMSALAFGVVSILLILSAIHTQLQSKFYLAKIDELTNKLMSRDYQSYVQAKVVEGALKTEIEKSQQPAEEPNIERF